MLVPLQGPSGRCVITWDLDSLNIGSYYRCFAAANYKHIHVFIIQNDNFVSPVCFRLVCRGLVRDPLYVSASH
jgi:hypothetical protein